MWGMMREILDDSKRKAEMLKILDDSKRKAIWELYNREIIYFTIDLFLERAKIAEEVERAKRPGAAPHKSVTIRLLDRQPGSIEYYDRKLAEIVSTNGAASFVFFSGKPKQKFRDYFNPYLPSRYRELDANSRVLEERAWWVEIAQRHVQDKGYKVL